MRPRDRAALILVALAVAFSVLAVGGAPRWAACTGALLGLASAAPYLTSRRTSSRPSPLLLPLAVAAGLTALQLVPLPHAIASQVVPAKLALVTDNATALGEPPPTWVMASYDPPATLVELAKLLGYLGLAYTCVRLATIRRARRLLATVVACVATLAALVTLAHHALGATSLYGVFTPEQPPHILGPLFGVNHLASLLSIATPIALALAVASTGALRVGWLAAAATLAGTTLLTGSRGGALGLAAGLVVVVTMLMVQRRAGTDDDGRRVPLLVTLSGAVIAACTVVLLAMLTAGDVANDLSRTKLDEIHDPHSKFQVWERTTTLVSEHRWLGVGKGGFEASFTRVSEVGDLTYTHVENAYLQAVVDWGLPGAALLALALMTAARAGVRRWRHGPLEAGVVAALCTLAVHDVADFSFEMPAVAMLTIVAASVIVPARLGETEAKRAPRKLVVTRGASIAGAAVVAIVALTPVGRSMRADAARVAAADPDDRLDVARAAWARHPSDYILAGRVAEALFQRRDRRAGPAIARGLAMNPLHTGLHLLAGRMFARSDHPNQAEVEFAAAARWAVDIHPVVDDVLRVYRDPEAIARALPAEPRQLVRVIDALGDHHDAAFAFARRVAELNPRDAEAQYTLGWTALRTRHLELAVTAAREAQRLAPSDLHVTVLAQALATSGDVPIAIATLKQALTDSEHSTEPARFTLLFTLVDLQLAGKDLTGARGTLEQIASLATGKPETLVKVHERLADLEEQLGNRNQADWERQEAARLRESAPER